MRNALLVVLFLTSGCSAATVCESAKVAFWQDANEKTEYKFKQSVQCTDADGKVSTVTVLTSKAPIPYCSKVEVPLCEGN